MSKKFLLFVLILSSFVGCSNAEEAVSCRNSKPKSFVFGEVSRTECTYKSGATEDFLKFQGRPILKDVRLFPDDASPDKSIRIYTSGAATSTACAGRLYLVDFNLKPPSVLAFGVKNACNVFHWASWGGKRTVIAIKNNVRFIYENGKLIPPKPGENLWRSVEPPHAGPGLAVEDAVGFVEVLSLPK